MWPKKNYNLYTKSNSYCKPNLLPSDLTPYSLMN